MLTFICCFLNFFKFVHLVALMFVLGLIFVNKSAPKQTPISPKGAISGTSIALYSANYLFTDCRWRIDRSQSPIFLIENVVQGAAYWYTWVQYSLHDSLFMG